MDEILIDNTHCVVRYMDMPGTVRGVTSFDSEGVANVYINTRLSYSQQVEALHHELEHVRRNDSYNDFSIEMVESI